MRRLVGLVVGVAVLAVACASDTEQITQRADPATLSIPSQLVGLSVQQEDIGKEVKGIEKPYVDTVAMFSLREEKLLQATLQVARFNSRARPKEAGFRNSVISTVGTTLPRTLSVGSETVHQTAGSAQSVFVWFGSRTMFVLSISNDFPFPRTLLRRTLDLELE